MLLHEDSISESHSNQILYSFQTILHVNTTETQNYKYLLNVVHRNYKNGKTTQTVITLTSFFLVSITLFIYDNFLF